MSRLRINRILFRNPRFYSTKPPSKLSPKPDSPHLRDLNRIATDSSKPFSKPTFPDIETGKSYTKREYNTAARRWTSIIVSIPLVLVTSWILYERLFLGKEQRQGLFEGPQSVGYIGDESKLSDEWKKGKKDHEAEK
jgi:hypothetical protein